MSIISDAKRELAAVNFKADFGDEWRVFEPQPTHWLSHSKPTGEA